MGNNHFQLANEWLEKKYGKEGMIDWTKLDINASCLRPLAVSVPTPTAEVAPVASTSESKAVVEEGQKEEIVIVD